MKLICYLSNGFPTLEASAQTAQWYGDAGCDLIEIDLPARDPYLESDLIGGRMADALAACNDYDQYMENIVRISQASPQMQVILLAYESTVQEVGIDKLITFCTQNDFMDMILVGLVDETIKETLIAAGIRVSCYVQFHMDPAEIESAKKSNGFAYLQATPTEGQATEQFPTLRDCVAHLRAQGIERPIYCGVGVHTPDDYRRVAKARADGAFVGSTILKLHDKPEELRTTIQAFKNAVN